MLNERIEAVRPVVHKTHDLEAAWNQAIIKIGELIASIPAARSAPGTRMPLTTGMAACEKLASAAASAARGYREVVEAHQCLAEDRDALGLRTVGWGDIFPCPPSAGDRQEAPLQLVRSA